jgi:hypothetical protein
MKFVKYPDEILLQQQMVAEFLRNFERVPKHLVTSGGILGADGFSHTLSTIYIILSKAVEGLGTI